MACCIAATLVGYESWKIAILGTDIGIEAIERAKSGQFGERAMRLVPEDYRRKFFQHAGGTRIWQLKPALQSLLAFRQHNLMEPLPDAPFDLVVLKNVLIYFDSASKQHVLRHVRGRVAPGGFLLCGAAEGAGDHLKSMVRLQPWLFRQPAEGPGR
jgi:chemotaxis protein methyltransferase CheR